MLLVFDLLSRLSHTPIQGDRLFRICFDHITKGHSKDATGRVFSKRVLSASSRILRKRSTRTLEIDRPRKLTRLLHATKHARFPLAISARWFSWIGVSRHMCHEYKKCTTTNVRMCARKSGIQCASSGTLIHRELFVSHTSV